ncbi:hypothetical protein UFOVP892_6 [uncultured Caudovirales phage]|uniref:Uncharacterized protein n=1 Tax=uncultured Caudovirales phage TaxID=2100421 RepID=A0A6J5RPC7_9CAUD|nr:hypothetical protein UFOVP892_6 [uncultured Caudovirales phage]CAB4195518.1 hypothetical protein UFOVP1291_20 [uncultured Caudovirales phage]
MIIENPKMINGYQLAQALGIPSTSVYMIEDTLYLQIEDEEKAFGIYTKHKPKEVVNFRAQALEKLAALGLTQEEISAL